MSRGCMVERAVAFARIAHEGQLRKFSGEPYVNHPIRVMEALEGGSWNESVLCAAVLHDVVEDAGVQLSTIYLEFGAQVAETVEELSRREYESYAEYIRRIWCSRGMAARPIKIADLRDNLRDLKPGSLRDKYELALLLLEEGR